MHSETRPAARDEGPVGSFARRLAAFGESIPNPYRQARFRREVGFFHAAGHLPKLALAHRLAEMLRRCEMATGSAAAGTVGSLVHYALRVTRVNPLAHELVFLGEGEDGPLDVEYPVGEAELDRLVSVLRRAYGAVTRTVSARDSGLPTDVVYASLTLADATTPDAEAALPAERRGRRDPFAYDAFGLARGMALDAPEPGVTVRHEFRFVLDPKADVIESCLRQLYAAERRYVPLEDLPLDDGEVWADWRLVEDAARLGLGAELAFLKRFEACQPADFAAAVALSALLNAGENSADLATEFIGHLHGKRLTATALSYHCLGLLEETGGLLVYEEQLVHLLHYLGGLEYGMATRALVRMRAADAASLDPVRRAFSAGAVERGLSEKRSLSIFHELVVRSRELVPKAAALVRLLPLCHLVFLKTRHRELYRNALATHGKE